MGDGYSAAHIDELGEHYGFRKIRAALDVTAFGVNAICVPPGFEANFHYHDEQEELYFVHQGRLEIEILGGDTIALAPGGLARVAPEISRRVRNVGDGDAIYLVIGGKGGYVGRDAHVPSS